MLCILISYQTDTDTDTSIIRLDLDLLKRPSKCECGLACWWPDGGQGHVSCALLVCEREREWRVSCVRHAGRLNSGPMPMPNSIHRGGKAGRQDGTGRPTQNRGAR